MLSHFLTDEQGSALVVLMTADDVKKTIFLKANKAQGPDGFTAELNSFNPGKELPKLSLNSSLPSSPQPADSLPCECAI